MNKYQRIQLVRALGLNTETNVLVSSDQDWATHADFLSRFPVYSVRTFRREPWSGPEPHFPLISADDLRQRYRALLAEDLRLIVATPIDPADAAVAGCLMVQADHFLAEVAYGPGTVRRVTHEGLIDRVVDITPGGTTGDGRLDQAARSARQALRTVVDAPFYELQGLIFEFSWYRVPVGWKQQPLIFWEIAGSEAQEALLLRSVGEES